MAEAQSQPRLAKRPVTRLAGPYGHPVHPALITVPIGAWLAALIFDLASHVVATPAFLTQGARWLIAIGILGALAAAVFGLLDLFAIPGRTPAFRTGLVHMSINIVVVAAYVINLLLRVGDPVTGPVSWGLVVFSAVSLALLGWSGYLGGKLAYGYGVRVADETRQAEGFRTVPAKAH
ncbi:DUF2231 domain-containing protein [Thermasporomyces composti]|jgi:uncharacterized membrane protein|uniref:Putative membrane protein n=1 Tax=Thermasporomyces composti TaxID=696763 RepID=A0A3D9VES2_THECX|nr:DUF2231 domain-containing protein [Thermasporomyces composti]REF35821.1 putative membrane protein [Thermasporomyces composti]